MPGRGCAPPVLRATDGRTARRPRLFPTARKSPSRRRRPLHFAEPAEKPPELIGTTVALRPRTHHDVRQPHKIFHVAHATVPAAPIAVVLATTAWTTGPVARARLPLDIDTARITIAGTSNIHEYTASTTTVRVTRVKVGPAVAGDGVLGRRGEARRARGVRDRHPRGDADVAEGRPRQEHAQGAEGRASIRTSRSACSRLEPAPRAGAHARVGVLHIAGVEREVALDAARRSAHDATLVVTGRAAAADDRLRHQAADGDARHAEDRSEGHGHVRDGARACRSRSAAAFAAHSHATASEDTIMRPTFVSPPHSRALLALASPAAAQTTADRAARPRRRPTAGRGTGRRRPAEAEAAEAVDGRPGRRAGRSRSSTSGAQDQRGLNVFETTKDPGVEFTGFKLDFGAAFTSQVQNLSHRNTADAEHRQRRQREPARRHRLRLQQLDGEPVPERAARARHPRRAHQLPVVAAPQRDVGEGRLHPDRRSRRSTSAPLKMLFEIVTRARRPHGDQLRRRALPPQRQRQRDLQPVRRQLHHGRVHHRDRRRGLPQDRRASSRWAPITGGEIRGTVADARTSAARRSSASSASTGR